MDQYDQDPLTSGLGAMDTTPIPPTEIPSPFIQPPQQAIFSPNTLLDEDSGMVFLPGQTLSDFQATAVAPSILSDMDMQVFLSNHMEAMDPATLHPAVSGFMPDLRSMIDPYALASSPEKLDLSPGTRTHSASPPQSQIPSPSIHGSSSSYGAGVTSSLESALDSTTVVGGRSRANTSLSPPSVSSSFPSATSDLDYAPSTSDLEESVSQKQPHTIIGKMLKNIAITAIDAGDAFENCQGLEQTNKVGELRDRIMQVLDMLSTLKLEKDTSSYNSPTPVMPGIVTDPVPPIVPMAVPPMEHVPITDTGHLSVSESRKRCASELEVHRTVKALKREPQDDAPLISSIQDASILAAITPPFVNPFATAMSPPAVVLPPSQPPSRPATPPNFPSNNSFTNIKPQMPGTTFPSFIPPTTAPLLVHSTSMPAPPVVPPFNHSPWSDPGPIISNRHQHSLSSGANSVPQTTSLGGSPFPATIIPSTLPHPPHSVPSNAASSAMSPALGRMSRSGSISGTNFRNPFPGFPYVNHPYSEVPASSWHANAASVSRVDQSNWYTGFDTAGSSRKFTLSGHSAPNTEQNSPSDDEDEDEDSDSDDSTSGRRVAQYSSDRHSTSLAAELPAEYQKDVDRIFFDFLNKLCSKLDATDAKGEQIHQTLMAKKMQRLDESPDFRPFKFRIQAFTNAFMDELAEQGYPEDKIPMKKWNRQARNYLWRQQYILRFNEDGKKAKSKGNHIWNVEARKAGEGKWEFRPFHRKLAGTPPSVAYCGLRWSWKPHVWHPQLSFKKISVNFSSPNLPSWLSWRNGELSGIPPPDTESCQVTAVANFNLDNQDDRMEHTFTITIAPASALDTPPYSRSRRTSLVGEQPPKRSTSDSALFTVPSRNNARINREDDTHVKKVLQNMKQRVTDKAESQSISLSPPKQGELQDLVKQKHVLERTVDAYDKAISGQGHVDSRRLAVAAQHVVIQAARTVMADRTVANGGVPTPRTETEAIQSVSVSELTDKTQDAIAMAVKMNGRGSNEMDIIVTATSILKSQTPVMDASPAPAVPPLRPPVPVIAAPSRLASTLPPPTLSPLPEYS